jgi:two-component system CheB/CheR fusion protein
MNQEAPDPKFEALLQFLQQSRGFDFTGYKRQSLMRRVARRMQELELQTYDDYRDRLEVDQGEFALLFDTILINVTSFFRDAPAWDFLASEVLPALLAAKKPDERVRVWSAGCASGEEAFSIAILLAEAMGAEAFRERVKIYATDVDEHALSQGRLASYSPKDLEPVAPELRERYFERANGRFQFRADLRRSVIFGRHDLMQDAPISRLDLLVCRNVLMYFNAEAQARILTKFHFALNGGQGYLFLGRAEMLLTHAQLFTPLDLKHRVFARVAGPYDRRPRARAAPANGNGGDTMPNDKLRDVAMDEFPVARIVVDADGNLAQANQRARVLFSINPRDIGRPLSDLEISYRPLELRSVIEQAYAERRAISQSGVERRFGDAEKQYLDIVVTPFFDQRQSPLGVAVVFFDATRNYKLQEELHTSREEVQTANEELQSSNEELETTNEELQSSNEELETTNEELQSTNEELETMNEELQSTNEELQAVNTELRQRTDDLNQSNAFLQSVFGSIHGAAIVVNREFDVLMWNQRAEDMWGLRRDEVQGRSLLSLDIGLPVGELRAPVRACLQGQDDYKQVQLDAVNRRGKSIKCRVSCTPLLSSAKGRDGVILLMDEVA